HIFDYVSPPPVKLSPKEETIATSVADAEDFSDLCALFGYAAEEHLVQTKDGYMLGLHRLPAKRTGRDVVKSYLNDDPDVKAEGPIECINFSRPSSRCSDSDSASGSDSGSDSGSNSDSDSDASPSPEGGKKRPAVYLHHGLLMNSEVWVSITAAERCLPFQLVDAGYDVWLGNNRGNKYSKKSNMYSPNSAKFWDFSIDEFAFYDIPAAIKYILHITGQKSLSYIGFSQGTAQALAALSVHHTLNKKVNCFIGLAPAMSPAGLSTGLVDSLVKASPTALFLAFGRGAILNSAPIWQSIFYRPLYIRVIDAAVGMLFGWHCRNMSFDQKLAAYPHLYSFTSTKSVVHWFQIIRNKTFQMYDNDMGTIGLESLRVGRYRFYKPAKFPTKNIKTPHILLLYGGVDSLVDIDVMLKELPRHTKAVPVPHYEHLDFLWANDVHEKVFPHVFAALKRAHGEAPSPAHRAKLAELQKVEADEMARKGEVAAVKNWDTLPKTMVPPFADEQEGWEIANRKDDERIDKKVHDSLANHTDFERCGQATAHNVLGSLAAMAGFPDAQGLNPAVTSEDGVKRVKDDDDDDGDDEHGSEAARPMSSGRWDAIEGK
ncbi:cholesterol esterase, partial [Ascosphaera atra]